MVWYQNAIFYQVYLRAFQDSDGDGNGDFAGLRDRIEYLEWLGIDAIWLMPFYPSPLKDDGYDISSFFGIHPDLGLLEDFLMTVDALHRANIRVVVDMVVNHTSDQHPWFKEARRSKDSPLRKYYVWSDTDEKYKDSRIIFLDTETSNWAYDEQSGQYYWHRFYSSQPDLNYDNPAVQQRMLDVMQFWLERGIDGFRVDAVPYLFEREGTNNENLPETHQYLKRMRAFIDAHFPNALLLAEANQWPEDLLPYFGDGDEFHMCFHFPVMPRLYKALATQDRSSVVDILNRTPVIPRNTQWATFIRNHDELTLEMVTEEDRQFLWDYYAPDPRERINLGIRRRLAPLMGNDQRKILLMHSMLYTLPGTPVMYYGDEIGMGDNIQLFDRNGVRTPMQWNRDTNGGFSSAPLESLYAPPISDPDFGYGSVNVAQQRDDENSLLHKVRHMIYTRKRLLDALQGDLIWMHNYPRQVLGFQRKGNVQTLLALHNLSDETVTVNLPFRCTDILTTGYKPLTGNVDLAPYEYRWLLT